jgi:hypothetical protein
VPPLVFQTSDPTSKFFPNARVNQPPPCKPQQACSFPNQDFEREDFEKGVIDTFSVHYRGTAAVWISEYRLLPHAVDRCMNQAADEVPTTLSAGRSISRGTSDPPFLES